VKILLDNGLNINYNNDSPYVPLLSVAFHNRNESIIKYLLDHGADVNTKLDNKTPLSLALLNFNESFIKYIIDMEADVNYSDCNNNTPLYNAIKHCGESIVKYLIDHGAIACSDVNLDWVLYRKFSEPIIHYLINHGAMCYGEERKCEPLLSAIQNNYSISIIKFMVEHGAYINEPECRHGNKIYIYVYLSFPLREGLKRRNLNLINYLREKGEKVKDLKKHEERPFITTFDNHIKKFKNYLMKQDMNNVNYNKSISSLSDKYDEALSEITFQYLVNKKKRKRKKDNNDDPVENKLKRKKKEKTDNIDLNNYLEEAIQNNYSEIMIRSIIDHIVDINQGFPLIKAIRNNYSETLILLLLKHGADTNRKDENGSTPLTLALTNSNNNVIKMLLDYGADANFSGEKDVYPFNLSIEVGNESLVQLFIDHGAKVRKTTPLITAIEKNFSEKTILYLIEHGASLQPDKILIVALLNNYSNIVLKALIDHGASITCPNKFKNSLTCKTSYSYIKPEDMTSKEESKILLLVNVIDRNNEEFVRYLIDYDHNSITELINCLGFAISRGCSERLIQYITKSCIKELKKDVKGINLYAVIRETYMKNNLSLISYIHKIGFNIYNDSIFENIIFKMNENIIKYLFRENPSYFTGKVYKLLIRLNYVSLSKNHCLIRYGRYEKIKELTKYFCNHGVILSFPDDVINYAIEKNDPEFLEYLLFHEESVDVKYLNIAINNENLNFVKMFIDAGININDRSNGDDPPLVLAIKNENLKIIKYLIDHGANLKVRDKSGNTLLKLAIYYCNIDILNYLLSKNIELDINTKYYTPLTYAITKKNLEIVKCLIENNTNPNNNMMMYINLKIKDTTPLIMAIELGDISMVKYLVEHGADIHQQNKNIIYSHPFFHAIKKSNLNILQYLIEVGGETTFSEMNKKCSFLNYAIENSSSEIIQYLVKQKVDLNKKNEKGKTPLMMTLEKNTLNINFIKYLIENGVDINVTDSEYESPLIYMIKYRNKSHNTNDIIKYLIDQDADLTINATFGFFSGSVNLSAITTEK